MSVDVEVEGIRYGLGIGNIESFTAVHLLKSVLPVLKSDPTCLYTVPRDVVPDSGNFNVIRL
jgi:hypothetical protein